MLRLVLRVESIGESVISVYNKHNDKIRPLSKDNVNDELFVALNGPQLGEADEVLEKSLDLHFSKSQSGWHFVTNTLFRTNGVEKILKKKNKLGIY